MLVVGFSRNSQGIRGSHESVEKKNSTFQVIHCSPPHPRSSLILIFLAYYLTNVICYPFNSK